MTYQRRMRGSVDHRWSGAAVEQPSEKLDPALWKPPASFPEGQAAPIWWGQIGSAHHWNEPGPICNRVPSGRIYNLQWRYTSVFKYRAAFTKPSSAGNALSSCSIESTSS